MDVGQFRMLVIRGPLQVVGLWSREAEELLLGTAAVESRLGHYIKQLDGGPAVGVFQMEPATHKDIWENYLKYRHDLVAKIRLFVPYRVDPLDMITDLRHAAVMARLHYLRVPEKLPEMTDLHGQAWYWKNYYNTSRGAGTTNDYIAAYRKYVEL